MIDIEETDEAVDLVERVGALDIGKAALTVCLRVPHDDKPGHRRQEVPGACHDHPVAGGASRPAACCWGDAGRDGGHQRLLEAGVLPAGSRGFTCWLLNARQVKNVPGRPKTDKLDAVWPATVVERGMCRPSFVPPAPIRRLRD